jgi:hypothetical protein
MTGRFMQYAAPHMAAAHTTVTTKLATEGSGRYHTRSSPTGPAEQEEGGSRPRSVSSLLILLRAMSKLCDMKRV